MIKLYKGKMRSKGRKAFLDAMSIGEVRRLTYNEAINKVQRNVTPPFLISTKLSNKEI